MGKWSHLKGKLPALADPETPYYERLHKLTDQLANVSLDNLAESYIEAEATAQKLAAEVSDNKLTQEAISRAMLRKMENENLDSANLRGYRWTPSPEPYPQVVDRVALREWAVKNGHEDTLSVPHQTLKAMAKNALENEEPLPEGVDLYLHTKFSRRKAS